MTDWKRVLRTIAPKGKRSIINGVADAMPQMIRIADLSTSRRLAHFLAQCAHESDGFRTTEEYGSGDAYEHRRDLGNTQPGDGRRFKGRGIIQLTGRTNYDAFGSELHVDLVNAPTAAARFPEAALTAALYWRKRGINAAADADDLRAVTRKINGGYNGLAQRAAYLKAAKRALAAPEPKAAPAAEQVTAADLRAAGSRTMAGTSQVTRNAAGAVGWGVASVGADYLTKASDAAQTASNIAQNASDIASSVQNTHEAARSTTGVLAWLGSHPGIMIGVNIAISLALAYCVWRIFHGARRIERARVDDANAALEALPAPDGGEEVAPNEADEGAAAPEPAQ